MGAVVTTIARWQATRCAAGRAVITVRKPAEPSPRPRATMPPMTGLRPRRSRLRHCGDRHPGGPRCRALAACGATRRPGAPARESSTLRALPLRRQREEHDQPPDAPYFRALLDSPSTTTPPRGRFLTGHALQRDPGRRWSRHTCYGTGSRFPLEPTLLLTATTRRRARFYRSSRPTRPGDCATGTSEARPITPASSRPAAALRGALI